MRRWLWPSFVIASALAYGLAFWRGAAQESVLLVPAVQVLLLVAFEAWLPADRKRSLRSDPAWRNDVAHNVIGSGLGSALSDAIAVAATALLAGRVAALAGGSLWPGHWPLAAQAGLVIFLADGLETVRHRVFHLVPWLWPIHAVHHAGDRLHVLKSGRMHALDLAARGLCVFAPLALLGAPPEALLAYPAANSVFGPIAHANLDLSIGPWLHRWLLTPPVHHVHHARELELALHNYAPVLPLWDRLLGTFLDPSGAPQPPAGLADDPNPLGLWAQLVSPVGWS
jgi:sterol desaturase/sphingolipid hydroxylase (fatty acid hydroxylase superfamily)